MIVIKADFNQCQRTQEHTSIMGVCGLGLWLQWGPKAFTALVVGSGGHGNSVGNSVNYVVKHSFYLLYATLLVNYD